MTTSNQQSGLPAINDIETAFTTLKADVATMQRAHAADITRLNNDILRLNNNVDMLLRAHLGLPWKRNERCNNYGTMW